MAILGEFGTAAQKQAEGYIALGTIQGSEDTVLKQFYSDAVCLVCGAMLSGTEDEHEYLVMVKPEDLVKPADSPYAEVNAVDLDGWDLSFINSKDSVEDSCPSCGNHIEIKSDGTTTCPECGVGGVLPCFACEGTAHNHQLEGEDGYNLCDYEEGRGCTPFPLKQNG